MPPAHRAYLRRRAARSEVSPVARVASAPGSRVLYVPYRGPCHNQARRRGQALQGLADARAARRPGEMRHPNSCGAGHLRFGAPSRLRTVDHRAPERSCGRAGASPRRCLRRPVPLRLAIQAGVRREGRRVDAHRQRLGQRLSRQRAARAERRPGARRPRRFRQQCGTSRLSERRLGAAATAPLQPTRPP